MSTPERAGGTAAQPLVYHYAAHARLGAICATGALLPSNAGAPGEPPLLWFSAHARWEPTATKAVLDHRGRVRQLSFPEHLALLGCCRFALSAQDPRLMRWQDACDFAGTPPGEQLAMEARGLKTGANPLEWFAIAAAVPLAQVELEVLTPGGWQSRTCSDAQLDWAARSPTAHPGLARLQRRPLL